MHVSHAISYFGGWELLIDEKPNEWIELQSALADMTLENLQDPAISGGSYRVKDVVVDPIRPSNLQIAYDNILGLRGWEDFRLRPRTRGGLSLFVRNLKNRVSTRLLAMDQMPNSTFTNWILLDVPRAADLGVCELSILLVPLDDVREFVSDDRAIRPLFTLDRCKAQLADLLPLRHRSPFLILAVGMNSSPITLEEIELEPTQGFGNTDVVEKCIEFPREYYQAGVGILSYFGEVLRQKHPDLEAKVRIEQDGLLVRLHIESASGDKEIIEKTLHEYSLVVSEKAPPESLLEDRLQIIALENKLEIARMEVRQTHQLLALSERNNSERIEHLEEEVSFLRKHIGHQLGQASESHRLLAEQNRATERLLIAHVRHSDLLIKDVLAKVGQNDAVLRALQLIDSRLEKGASERDEEELREALTTIKEQEPTLFQDVGIALTNVMYGVSGNYVYQIFQAVASAL